MARWQSSTESPTYKHGHACGSKKSTTYKSWQCMNSRCKNENLREYHRYGGRGIKVCKRWNKFENFLADMGEKPIGLWLERINNDGDYKPSNCEWATINVQSRNKRNAFRISYKGETKSVWDWAEQFGLNAKLLKWRIWHGWTASKAFATKVMTPHERCHIALKTRWDNYYLTHKRRK